LPTGCRYAAGAGMRRSSGLQDVGQKIAPAFSALPPSLVVVCSGHRDANDCMDLDGRAVLRVSSREVIAE
jgi:hypothetical protein